MRTLLLVIFIILNNVSTSDAQRIRYKNLFPLLQSRDYKTAAPQLLKFLEENDDEANAYFYLGEIIMSKVDSVPIFPSTEKFDSLADKAIEAYKKSISLVDDRELRKNDDYYAAYNRRDLRTGKFGIKKSDVHLAYEKKIQAAREQKELIAEIHELREKAVQEHRRLQELANHFHGNYPDAAAFLLRATVDDKDEANTLTKQYNSFITSYSEFSKKLNSLNHPEYNAELVTESIEKWDDLQLEPVEMTDFTISMPHYESYLKSLLNQIETEIKPLQEMLFKTNQEFDEAILKNRRAQDSTDIVKIEIPEKLKTTLKQFDDSNLIVNLLSYKRQKSRTELISNVKLFPVLADTSNIYQRANLIQDYEAQLSEQLNLINNIEGSMQERTVKDFQTYVTEYEPSLATYIETEKTLTEQALNQTTAKSAEMSEQIQFFRNDSDSIYLTPMEAASHESRKYVLNTIELDSMLLLGGVMDLKPYLALAGFDMKIKSLEYLKDSSFTFTNVILLNKNILVNLSTKIEDSTQQSMHYLKPSLEQVWELQFHGDRTLGDAKEEAGIFFIYDQEGGVLKTLNAEGKVIGN